MNIGDRLKAERERLGFSQAEFGQFGGAGRTTVIAWERGTAFPNAAFLAVASDRGVDVRYVITGSRDYDPPEPLSPEEQVLLDRWRAASRETKNAAMGALLGAGPRRGAEQVFHAPVGQAVRGNVRVGSVQVNEPPPAWPRKWPRKP